MKKLQEVQVQKIIDDRLNTQKEEKALMEEYLTKDLACHVKLPS
jgi:hypothetical protein